MKTGSETVTALRPPETVVEITRDLERAGYDAWCVGGAVRDALLGHSHLDWDLSTNATPEQVRAVFGGRRTIPVGLAFGTVGVLDSAGVAHEVTTFRKDVRTDGRHAEVEFGASLDEDLARRDFTVNAIAFSPSSGRIHDPFDGRGDLRRGLVRAVGDPDTRMREDRLRALRGMRFAARLGFEIEPATWAAIVASAPHLTRLSAERVRQELEKTMDQVAQPSRAFQWWKVSGAFGVLIPELENVTVDVLRAVDCAAQPGPRRRPARRLVRLAVLFSDLNADTVAGIAVRLRFSKREAHALTRYVQSWRTLESQLAEALAGEPRPADVRRWIASIGRLDVPAFYRLAHARWLVQREQGAEGTPSARAVRRLYRRMLQACLTEAVDLCDLAIDGDDLREAGIAPGPRLGSILSSLLDRVIDDPRNNTRNRLLELAREMDAKDRDQGRQGT